MKAKTQLLTLVSMATLALGGVTVTSSLLLNTPENHSINAETVDDTVGTVRLWVADPENGETFRDWNCTPRIWFQYDGNAYMDPTGYVDNSLETVGNGKNQQRRYYYFDFDTDTVAGALKSGNPKFEVQCIENGEWKRTTSAYDFTMDNMSKIIYVYHDDDNSQNSGEGRKFNSVSCAAAGMDMDAKLISKVIEGLQSCSSSVYNGYGIFESIGKNFIHSLNNDGTIKEYYGRVNGLLSDCTISDYADIKDYETGTRSVQVNAQDKYDMLNAMAGNVFSE